MVPSDANVRLAKRLARRWARHTHTDWREWVGPIWIEILETGQHDFQTLLAAARRAWELDRTLPGNIQERCDLDSLADPATGESRVRRRF